MFEYFIRRWTTVAMLRCVFCSITVKMTFILVKSEYFHSLKSVNSIIERKTVCIKEMPIFSRKFDVKHLPARSKRQTSCPPIEESPNDYRIIHLNLGKKRIKFEGGTWIIGQHTADTGNLIGLKQEIQQLKEANNLNRLKIDVLLDMLTENLAELNTLRSNKNVE